MDNKIVALCTIALISIVVVLLTSVARVNALSVAYHHRSVDDEQRGVVVGGYNMNHGAASSSSSDGDGESAMRHDDDVLDAGRSVQRSDANQQQKEVTTMWDTRTIHDDDDEEDDDVDDEEDEDVDVNGEDIINWNEQDKESLRQRILLSLGLESEPEVSEDQISQEALNEAYALYRQRVEETERRRRSSLISTQVQQVEPKQGITYTYQDQGISRPIHVVPPYSDNATTWWLFFPVTNLTSGQTRTTSDTQESNLITATLRIYRKPQNGPSDDQTSPTTSPIIHLYHVNADDQLLLVDSRSVTPTGHLSYYSWDVSDSVRQWSHDSNLNRGLLVTCSPCDNDLGRFLWRTTDHQHHHQSDVTVPSVVVHVAQEPVELSRSKRNAQSLEDALISWSPFSTPQGIVDCPKKKSGEMTCCRKKLKINMVELGLDRWILQPRQFDAHYCVGKCPSKHSPASTHALIQGYLAVHRLKSRHKKPPQPCCAPSQLAKLDIMFFNKTGHLVIQPWDNVVVSKCACS